MSKSSPFSYPKTRLGPWGQEDPIRTPWLFVGGDHNNDGGRKALIDEIKESLDNPKPIHIVGCYGIGKTATVDYAVIEKNREIASHLNTQYAVAIVTFQGQSSPESKHVNQLVKNVFKDVYKQVVYPGLSTEELDDSVRNYSLNELLSRLRDVHRYERFVIVLDSIRGFQVAMEEIQNFIEEVLRYGWVPVVETHHDANITYRKHNQTYSLDRKTTKGVYPVLVRSETEDSSLEEVLVESTPLHGLSNKDAKRLIRGESKEDFRQPYYLSQWRVWIPNLIFHHVGTHPLLLHAVCYQLDHALRNRKFSKQDVLNGINRIQTSHHSTLDNLRESVKPLLEDLGSEYRETRQAAYRRLKQQGLLTKKWYRRSSFVAVLGTYNTFLRRQKRLSMLWYKNIKLRFLAWYKREAEQEEIEENVIDGIKRIEELHRKGVFALLDTESTPKGTGFFTKFDEKIYGVTCAHVVKKLCDNTQVGEKVNIEFVDGTRGMAEIIYYSPPLKTAETNWSASEDVAILKVETPSVTRSILPLSNPNEEYIGRGPCNLFGYFVRAGAWEKDIYCENAVGVGMYQLSEVQIKGLIKEETGFRGASGSPICDTNKGEHIGMFRAQERGGENFFPYLIPSTIILNILKEINVND
ncbi:MAG: trypsin-like peptidase domain-containing protein [Ardenticatenaceae bacterium]|nr:trypsin-like peptidase domain-containing protein [Ardenticatenaceae bacterium]